MLQILTPQRLYKSRFGQGTGISHSKKFSVFLAQQENAEREARKQYTSVGIAKETTLERAKIRATLELIERKYALEALRNERPVQLVQTVSKRRHVYLVPCSLAWVSLVFVRQGTRGAYYCAARLIRQHAINKALQESYLRPMLDESFESPQPLTVRKNLILSPTRDKFNSFITSRVEFETLGTNIVRASTPEWELPFDIKLLR